MTSKNRILPFIKLREHELLEKLFKFFKKEKKIFIFGPKDPARRVSIVSFNIKHKGYKGERILHPAFVIRLLSDLFGIQGRSGCSCAGPYGHRLFGITDKMSEDYLKWVSKENGGEAFFGIKLGWARINLHYVFSDEELDYILQAIQFTADYGHIFLQYYLFNPISGNWAHFKEEEGEKKLLGLKLLLNQKLYAKDERSRSEILKRQLIFAKRFVQNNSNKKFKLDPLKEWGNLAFCYAAEGNVQHKDGLQQKKNIIKRS